MAKCAARRTPLWLCLDKCAMKIFGINGHCGINFFIVLHRCSLVKLLWMLRALVKCPMTRTKRLNFLIQVRNEYSPQPSKLLFYCQFKTKRRCKTLKDSQRALFLKKIYRMILISAGSISLNSTFKVPSSMGPSMRYLSTGFFLQIRPVREGDLGTRAKHPKKLWLGPYI
jgi:hypothetical protein